MAGTIPAFLSFDVEPNGFQLYNDSLAAWTGFEATVRIAEKLRHRLGERSGRVPRFGWYLRMDPQIAEVFGRAGFVASAFAPTVATLSENDYFGIHMHPLRRSADSTISTRWVHDFADQAWFSHCIESSVRAFTDVFGARPERYRGGGAFISDESVIAIERAGFRVDLTLEPVSSWGPPRVVSTAIDESPYVGTHSDCGAAPREIYRPARDDFRAPDPQNGRDLVLIPLSASRILPEKPLWWRVARAIRTRPVRQRARMLHPWGIWESPRAFWDLVERHLGLMKRPYLSLAVRTEAPESDTGQRIDDALAALPDHPVAEKLDFTDPLAAGTALLPGA